MQKCFSTSIHLFIKAITLVIVTGCVHVPTQRPVPITTAHFPSDIARLPSPPPELTNEEKDSDWGIEYRIGKGFAREGDFYRALTCFHRARHLLSEAENAKRRANIVHAILLTYSLGNKHQEAVSLWEQERHHLEYVNQQLIDDYVKILFECYTCIGNKLEANYLLESVPSDSPLQCRLPLYQAVAANDEKELLSLQGKAVKVGEQEDQTAQAITTWYSRERKNPTTARTLNALLPGAGYCYVRQYKTAVTSLAINALFITAAVQLFAAKQQAAAIIAGSFEIGWYLGGVTGAGIAAELYNQRLREHVGKPFLEQYKLFPLQQIVYSW